MALTRITKGVIKPNENYDTHNINSTGIVTAIGLDVNGNGDISGNLSVGGILTYEDVTSIDSVGIITAQKDIHVGAGISVVGVGSFGSLDISGDLDVDGHTNLDNVSVAGVSTFADRVTISGGKDLFLFDNGVIRLGNDSNSYDFQMFHNGNHTYFNNATGSIYINNSSTNGSIRLSPKSGENGLIVRYEGAVEAYHSNTKRIETTSTGAIVTGILTATTFKGDGDFVDLDVDGHTELDNANVSGIVTFSNTGTGIQMLNDKTIQFGSAAASRTSIYYDASSTRTRIRNFNDTLEIGYRNTEIHHTNVARLSFLNGQNVFSNNGSTTFTGSNYHAGWYPSSNGGTFKLNDNARLAFGIDADTNFFHNNSHFYLQNTTGNINVTGNVILNNDLDVDGHTNLDNVSIAGVSTVTNFLQVLGQAGTSDKGFEVRANSTQNTDTNKAIRIRNNSNTDTFNISYKGKVTATELDISGNIDVDGHTNLDNVSIAGVTTTSGNLIANHSNGQVYLKPSDGSIEITRTGSGAYIDFKNSTSEDYDARINEEGGHIRVNTNFRLYDNKALELGNRTSSTYGDLRLYHDTSNSIIENFTGALYIRNYDTNSTDIVLSARRNILLQTNLNETAIQCLVNGATEIFHDGGATPKLRTTATGVEVLGEVEALQDYPDSRPSLDLNFASTKKLDSRIKYTRSGRASFINEKGLLEIVNSNVPRFDHDPVTRECKGLLIEETRTNLITYSNAPGMSSPNLGGSPQTNDTVSNITLPTGEKGDVRRYLAASGGGGGRWGAYSGNANVPKTGSVWVRTVSGTGSAVIDIADGGGKTVNLTEEWQRVTTTYTPSNAYEFFDIYFATPVTIYYWGVQIEEGAFMSSYIPTNNATATRGLDICYIDGQDLLDFYNPVESTILVDYSHLNEVTTSNIGTEPRVYRFKAVGGSDTRIDYVSNSGYNPYIAKDGSGVASISHGQSTVFGGGLNRNAVRVKENSFAVSFNGSAVSGNALDTSGGWNPTNAITEVNLGVANSSGSHPLNGHIRRFTYYPVGLPNSQLVTLTS